jgi:hypothetical protein
MRSDFVFILTLAFFTGGTVFLGAYRISEFLEGGQIAFGAGLALVVAVALANFVFALRDFLRNEEA